MTLGAVAAALLAAGAAQAAPSVQVKDAVARVVVIPEARSDILVEFQTKNASLPLTVRTEGDKTIVDGGLGWNRVNSCNTINGVTSVHVTGVGNVAWADMPQIIIHTPMDVDLGAGGAVFGSIGRASSVGLNNAGCGDWTVANVDGLLKINEAGSGDVKAGTAGATRINIAGSGDVDTQGVGGNADVAIAGSGDVKIAWLTGNLSAKIAGSGDVTVNGGAAKAVSASILGSGDVKFNGDAGAVSAKIAGSGDVRLLRVSGPISKSVAGSGSVYVGDKNVSDKDDDDDDN
ncbi:hypothetical protein QO010_000482 [Caulobacter ginsengisoli]|uniref:Putative auto-transporter adhesin head GIN domain-containing protein n=1 Tax=Caulobacter ginsengisoli TaxID=400775 RepID=A0ABU0INY8_9CAUL|nr:DUF2807 domain-containing protein [Caulobacter ginsengisoli]MDQ0462734.1 hypothetical protein [Caulobacter ginsengisoli]